MGGEKLAGLLLEDKGVAAFQRKNAGEVADRAHESPKARAASVQVAGMSQPHIGDESGVLCF